jgi:hypothetical protein
MIIGPSLNSDIVPAGNIGYKSLPSDLAIQTRHCPPPEFLWNHKDLPRSPGNRDTPSGLNAAFGTLEHDHLKHLKVRF